MAKETANGSGFKNPLRFNEQVNTILLIMFLAVVLLLSLNAGNSILSKQKEKSTTNAEQSITKTDSIQRDSIISIH